MPPEKSIFTYGLREWLYIESLSEKLKMETEKFISGFCRTCNGSQTVCCEYEEKDGKRVLTFMDCAYKRCVNNGSCEIYKEAHRLENE